MPLIERYLLRRTVQVFLLTLGALTAVFWIALVLRELDVVTAKGQAIWVYLLMTVLGLPTFVQLVAPIALLAAIIIALNSLTSDSELPVISAAGASPKAVNRPVILLGVVVMLAVAASHHIIVPSSLSAFRTILTQVRADVIATLVREGGFRTLENGLTMHFRDRTADGGYRGVFINDERDERESRTFSAARGFLIDRGAVPFLAMQDGDLIRQDHENGEDSVVTFETYALDLSRFGPPSAAPVFEAMERSTLFLLDPPPTDTYWQVYPQRVRAEIHDRITAPLYTLVFAFIALGFLGRPRTTRQDRGTAIVAVVVLCLAFRGGGFAAASVGRELSAATPFIYGVPMAGLVFGIYAMLHDTREWATPLTTRTADAAIAMARRIRSPGGMADAP